MGIFYEEKNELLYEKSKKLLSITAIFREKDSALRFIAFLIFRDPSCGQQCVMNFHRDDPYFKHAP